MHKNLFIFIGNERGTLRSISAFIVSAGVCNLACALEFPLVVLARARAVGIVVAVAPRAVGICPNPCYKPLGVVGLLAHAPHWRQVGQPCRHVADSSLWNPLTERVAMRMRAVDARPLARRVTRLRVWTRVLLRALLFFSIRKFLTHRLRWSVLHVQNQSCPFTVRDYFPLGAGLVL